MERTGDSHATQFLIQLLISVQHGNVAQSSFHCHLYNWFLVWMADDDLYVLFFQLTVALV